MYRRVFILKTAKKCFDIRKYVNEKIASFDETLKKCNKLHEKYCNNFCFLLLIIKNNQRKHKRPE